MLVQSLFAEHSLTVKNPDNFSAYQGSIEEASLTVRPQGLFYNCSIYLTFSAGELAGSDDSNLEIKYEFELPEKAIMHEAWLWYNNDTLRAGIENITVAKTVFDTTVKGNKDPLLLFKKAPPNTRLEYTRLNLTLSEKSNSLTSFL